MALSRERIADEWLKLLGLPDPVPTVGLMLERGVLLPVLPEIAAGAEARLAALVAAERAAGIAPAALRRLAALLPRDVAVAEKIAARLKLSNKARKRLAAAADPAPVGAPRAMAYALGTEVAQDRLLLADRPQEATSLVGWTPPRLPLGGGQLIARGLAAGPVVARTLKAIERRWVEEEFPEAERLEVITNEELARATAS
jgi:poly(A) polymerase